MPTRTRTSAAPSSTSPDRSSAASTTARIVSPASRGLQITGGSLSVRSTGHYGMRVAGAAAREMIVAAAAKQFGVSASECTVANSHVTHAASGKSATFGELAKAAVKESVPSHPALKDPNAYTLRRTARQRLDLRSKVDGSAIYGIDFTIAGMLHAAVEIAPVFGGKLVAVDTAAAEKMPGVKRVVKLEEAVAVVADYLLAGAQGARDAQAAVR